MTTRIHEDHGGVKRSITSDDSSEEDEPITEAAVQVGAKEVKRDDLNNAWMAAEEEDEEEEDADWSQLAASSTALAKPITPATTTSTTTPSPSIDVDDSKRSPRFKRLWATVGRDQWNTEAWTAIMNEVQTFPIEEARVYYEAFFTIYPTAGPYWKLYAEHEFRYQQYEQVETILTKSLIEIQCPCIELWLYYLQSLKNRQIDSSTDPETIQTARQRVCEAYEVAVERLGGVLDAAPLWLSYLQFLQEDTHPQSFLTVRKLFHRILPIPLVQMEKIWYEYEVFEKGIPNNEALAAGFFKLYRQKFDAARAVLRDRQVLWEGIARPVLAVPVTPQTVASYRQTLRQWQAILAYEMKNPERLPTLQWKRCMHAIYELILSSFRYAPEIWYQYASFVEEARDMEAAVAIYTRGIQAIPSSSYLVFALADHYELRGELKAAKALYENHLKGPFGSALVYITYQRFARRAWGVKGIQESRAIFKRARKDDREGACTYHVYAAAAMLEFYSDPSETGREIALNIFELGLKSFISEPNYILCYINFLSHLHDDKNMRSFFEKVLAVMPMEQTRPIWDRYVAFEHSMVKNGGDLATVAKVEARRALAFPEGSLVELKGLLSVYHRYSFLDLDSSSTHDQLCMETYRKKGRGEEEEGTSSREDSSSGVPVFDDRLIPGPPMPEFLIEFAALLPLHQPWNGPIADVEHIYRAMLLVDFPPRSQIEYMEQQQSMEQERMIRRTEEEPVKETIGVSVSNKRPPNDVFRARQKQKLAKLV